MASDLNPDYQEQKYQTIDDSISDYETEEKNERKIDKLYKKERKNSKKRYIIPALLFAGAGLVCSLVSCEKDSQTNKTGIEKTETLDSAISDNLTKYKGKTTKLGDYSIPAVEYKVLEQISEKYWSRNLSYKPTPEELLSQGKIKISEYKGNYQVGYLDLSKIDLKKLPEEIKYFTQLQEIDLSKNKIEQIKEIGLDKLTQLQKLNLSSNKISKIERLENLTKLEYLNLNKNEISKIQGLDKLTQLQKLYLRKNEISRIEGLDNLIKLQKLNLSSNKISEIQGLDKLTQLEYLNLSKNEISKIQGLGKATNLQKLDLKGNPLSKKAKKYINEILKKTGVTIIQDESGLVARILETKGYSVPFSESIALEKIYNTYFPNKKIEELLKDEKIKISEHKKEHRITYLDLSKTNLKKIPVEIDSFSQLQELDLSFNKISKIERLDRLTKLQTLNLGCNNISKIEGLDKLIKLQRLNLGEIPLLDKTKEYIQNIQNLKKKGIHIEYSLIKMTQFGEYSIPTTEYKALNQISKKYYLFYDDNLYSIGISQIGSFYRVTDLKIRERKLEFIPEEINHLTQLQKLDLHANRIKKIENLDKLTQLQKLDLRNNYISEIEGLENLTQLQALDLSLNKISKIEGLDNLPQLKELNLSYNNQISKIEGLDKLTQLLILNLSNNYKISKIQRLDNLTKLQKLWLSDNKISKIEGLDKLTQLQELDLDSNKIFRIEGIDNLTLLQKIELKRNPLSDQAKKDLEKLKRKGIEVKY